MKGASSFGTPKSSAEAIRNSAETAQSIYRKEEHTIMGSFFTSTAKNPIKQETKICREYTIEATIQHKMRLNKCDAFTAKKTLGYRGSSKKERNKRINNPTNK